MKERAALILLWSLSAMSAVAFAIVELCKEFVY